MFCWVLLVFLGVGGVRVFYLVILFCVEVFFYWFSFSFLFWGGAVFFGLSLGRFFVVLLLLGFVWF